MKALLLVALTLALAGSPAQAGVSVSIHLGGGGYHGGSFSGGGARCGYPGGFYTPYRSCYIGYPAYAYSGYGYYGAYSPYYYNDSYNVVSYSPTYAPAPAPMQAPPSQPVQSAPVTEAQTVAAMPAPAATPAAPPAQLEFGILDVNGYVHSPYSDALLKIPSVRNAQMVYDPVTGKPFLVR